MGDQQCVPGFPRPCERGTRLWRIGLRGRAAGAEACGLRGGHGDTVESVGAEPPASKSGCFLVLRSWRSLGLGGTDAYRVQIGCVE
jgi:hypothetical protein